MIKKLLNNHTCILPGLSASYFKPLTIKKILGESQKLFYPLIMKCFNYKDLEYYDWATLRARHDGYEEGEWLCADPMHLSVDLAHVYSLGNAYLELTFEEAQAYIDYLNDRLPNFVSLKLGRVTTQWYLKTQRHCEFQVCAPDGIFGKTLVDKMPQGRDATIFLSLFNEIQMLLHECELNQKRRLLGQPTLDALWIWGAGKKIEQSPSCRWDYVISNNGIVLQLAMLNNIACAELNVRDIDFRNLSRRKLTLIVDDTYQFRDAVENAQSVISKEMLKFVRIWYLDEGLGYVKKSGLIF